MVTVHIKHASKVHDVSVDTTANGLALKQQLEKLTGVPPDRQKIMYKGRRIADDADLSAVKDGQAMFLLGSAAPVVLPVVSAETEPEQPEEDEYLVPLGLTNIGNTCYANATLQALRRVPELSHALTDYHGSSSILTQWAQLIPRFGVPSSQQNAPLPAAFLTAVRHRFPQFAEIGEGGIPKQQDAEEFLTQLLSELRGDASLAAAVNVFEGRARVSTAKKDGGEVKVTEEEFTKLLCHITSATNFLKDGLRQSLKDEMTLDDEDYVATKQISRLPKWLTVQFVRFFWRKDTQVSSKILRKVTFPLSLDVGDICTPELQAQMAPARETYRELENAVEETRRAARRAKFRRLDEVVEAGSSANPAETSRIKAADAEKAEEQQAGRVAKLTEQFRSKIDAGLANDLTCSPHGLYDLQAVITHRGMSADSGHYQCFVRGEKPNSWWRFNDDSVSEVDDNRIAQLAGGGAGDAALILLYKSSE